MSGAAWVVASLVLANLVSGIGVIYASYDTRQQFGALQILERKSQQLKTEFGQLLLEKSAWAAAGRIEQKARTELGMQELGEGSIKILEKNRD